MIKDTLYYKDNYMKEFEAKVINCILDEKTIKVVLDNTAFYPEGGGQPSDQGMINDVNVLKVEEKDGVIYHICDKEIEVGTTVKCKLDFEKRFINMQLHTAEHIVSGLICKKYEATNVGFHIGQDYTTMDFDKTISQDDIKLIEKEANKAIYERIDVIDKIYSKEEVTDISYRSKKELNEDVRLVEIKGYDICACCGVHVSNTSEIGIIKIIKVEKYKTGVRVYMLAGQKAIADYDFRFNQVNDISTLLSLKINEVYEGIVMLSKEMEAIRKEKQLLKNKIFELRFSKLESKDVVIFHGDGIEQNEMKAACEILLNKAGKVACIINQQNRFMVMSKNFDLKEVGNSLREKDMIKGGGNSDVMQGQVTGDIREFIKIIGEL